MDATVKKKALATHCPICRKSIGNCDNLNGHLAQEIQKIEELSNTTDNRPRRRQSSTSKGKNSTTDTNGNSSISNYTKTSSLKLMKIRARRIKRESSRKTSRNSKKRYLDDTDKEIHQQKQRCFICNLMLPKEPNKLNEHIDGCLAKQLQQEENDKAKQQQQSKEEEEEEDVGYDEYTWAGVTRIRATSMLEGGFSNAGFTVHRKGDKDTDEDIDIDNDESSAFGDAQFGESSIEKYVNREGDERIFIPQDDDDDDNNHNHNHSDDESLTTSGDEINIDDVSSDRPIVPIPDNASGDTKMIIESLKSRLKSLSKSNVNRASCQICMSDYRKPCVSVTCWHVHCESCWLQSLGYKRVCPRCQVITGPTDLRQIYL